MFEQSPLWVLGLCFMIVGTFASSVGMLCLKRGGSPEMKDVPWYRNSWFWTGFLLFVVTAAGLDVIVFAVTPLAMIAPFAGLTIVVSFIFASVGCCGVNETPTTQSIVAVCLIVLGVTICSIFGPKDSGNLTPVALTMTFDQHPIIFALCISGGILFLIFTAVCSVWKKDVDSMLSSWGGALSLAILAAVFAALTQLQFKAIASAILEEVEDVFGAGRTSQQIYSTVGEFVLQIFSTASSAVAQIGFLNYGVGVAPIAYSVPAYQGGLLIFTLLLSGFILGEYDQLNMTEAIFFWLGAGSVGLGMVVNAWGLVAQAQADASKQEAEGGGEMVGVEKTAALLPDDDAEAAQQASQKAASAKFS